MNKLKYSLMLILAALIWGAAFVAQSIGMDYIGPHTFCCVRFAIGAVAMMPLIAYRTRRGLDETPTHTKAAGSPQAVRRRLLIAGALCGTALFIASTLQQFGLTETDAGKSGFITAMYIVLVPVFGLFLGRRASVITALSAALGVLGLYLLCINGAFVITRTDVYLILCALFFSVQILLVDHFAPTVDPVRLTCAEFLVHALLSGICMIIFETPHWSDIIACALPLLYAGLLSSGVGYTLQTVAQSKLPPALASISMSLESVFSVLAGMLILGETLTGREWAGCAIMFAAVILSILGDMAASKRA